MVTVTVEEMQDRLPDLLENVKQGEDVLITQDDQPFARLSSTSIPKDSEPKQKRQLGFLKGKIILADDYVTPLDDFKDYM